MRLNKLKLALVGAATLTVGALVWNHYSQSLPSDPKLAVPAGLPPVGEVAEVSPAAHDHACGENCSHLHPQVAVVRKAFEKQGVDAISARFPELPVEGLWNGHVLGKPILARDALVAKKGDKVALNFGEGEIGEATLITRATRKDGAQVFGLDIPGTGFYLHYIEFPDNRIVGRISKRQHPVSYRLAGTIHEPMMTRITVTEDYCADYSQETNSIREGIPSANGGPPVGTPVGSVAKLDSRLGAPNVIYLDFDGENVLGTAWAGGGDINAAPSTFSTNEIQEIWQYVSEDYRSFNVNVTTDRAVFDAATIGQRMMVIFTPTEDAAPGAGGVAFLQSFHDGIDEPCWVFNAGVNSGALAASHEVGHTLDLVHDGRLSPTEEYYAGNTLWGPIMGAPYDSSVVHWSKGEYISANNPEDDLAIIASHLTYNADSVGGDTLTASTLTTDSDGNFVITGDIEQTGDLDFYAFDTSGGTISISAVPTGPSANSNGQNLNIRLRILDSGGGTVIDSNAEGDLETAINTTMVGGSYFLVVEGGDEGTWATNGYENYGSIGGFTISGNLPVPTPGDFDGDRLSDDEELLLGTDPYDRDTDGDGLSDRTEVYHYLQVSGAYTFTGALADALSKGGILAIIDSPEKLYRVKRGLLTNPLPNPIPNNYNPDVELPDRLWIGGHDSTTDGRFQWITPLGLLNGNEIGSACLGYLTPGSNVITNVVNIQSLTVGRRVVASGIPGNTTITGMDTVARTITLSNPVGAAFNQGVGQVIIQNRGTGFISPPTISFNPPGATAVATVALGRITSINVTNPGSYTVAPTVTISGGSGGGASGLAVLTPASSQSRITNIVVTNGGSGYTSAPTVVIAGLGSGATAEATVESGAVTAIAVLNPGLGYTTAPTITLVGGGGIDATATAQIADAAGRIYSPAAATTYSRWSGLLPGNRLNVPEGVTVNSGTEFLWSATQASNGLGYLMERPSTNPLVADTDADGINDKDEFEVYGTNPTLADTDGDGLSDSAEIFTHKTNPLQADTDGDGLTDGEEVNGINGFTSNPLVIDTDGDLVNDFDEVNALPPTNPNDSTSFPGGSVPNLSDVHSVVTIPYGPQTVTIADSMAPFGHRPETDKIGEDGSVVLRDRNGVLIWVDKDGSAIVVPNASLARALYVSNTECVLYQNRYAPNYNLEGTNSEIVVHRRNGGAITSTGPTITLAGTVIDTAPVTPTTFGFSIISVSRFDDGTESRQRYVNGANDNGPTYAIRDVDEWDPLEFAIYRITWDSQVQDLDFANTWVRTQGNTNLAGLRILGHGSDGSFAFTQTVALDYFDDVDDDDPGFFKSRQATYWFSNQINVENIQEVPLTVNLSANASELGYISNDRLVVEAPESALVEDGNYVLHDFRQRTDGLIELSATYDLPALHRLMPFAAYSRRGLPIYLYTLAPTGASIAMFRLDATLTQLGAQAALSIPVELGSRFVRNPRDGSLLIKAYGNNGILWLPTVANATSGAITGFGVPQVLFNTELALPMFVNRIEAVTWNNFDAPVDIGAGGVVPPAVLTHYQANSQGTVSSFVLTPPIEGRYVNLPSPLTMDPDSEGWYITTFEKSGARSAILRTYQLALASTADRDGDGVTDVQEIALGTNPNVADTDNDGIPDGLELYPFQIVRGSFTWTEARDDAFARGGKLAELKDSATLAGALSVLKTQLVENEQYWIGGNDVATEGSYRWVAASGREADAVAFTFTNWQPGFPSNRNNSDGVKMSSKGQWIDDQVENRLVGYVLQLRQTNPLSKDSDGDGTPDGSDRVIDTDNDGVSDYIEGTVLGTDPFTPSFGGNANPANPPNFGSPLVNGTYSGMTFDAAGKPAATMSVSISSRGAFSAGLSGVGGAGGFRGSLDVLGRFVGFVNLPGGRTRVDFNLEFDGVEWVVRGSTSNNGVILSRYELRRPAYSRSAPFAPSGRYTFAATSPSTPDVTVLGDAIGSGTISTDGVANFRGYFPDGTAWTASSRLVSGDAFAMGVRTRTNPVRTMLATLKVTRATLPELSDLTGLFRIHRPTVISNTSFTRGYDQVRSAIGSTYIPPAFQQMAANWFEPYGMNSVLRFTNGGLQDTRLIGAWYPGGNLLVPNNAAYVLSGGTSNLSGDVWGSYQIKTGRNTSLGIVNNKASFRGVILQKSEKVSGFYLAPASSGQIVIDPNLLGEEPDYTIVGPASMSVPGTGRTYTVSVFTQGDWEVEIPVEAAWVTAVVAGSDDAAPLDGTGDGLVSIVVARNETDFARSATIYIAGQAHSIYQSARTTTISPASKTVSAAGSTYVVGVNTIGAVTATVVTGADWITATADSTTRTVTIVVAPNTAATKRVGTVNISGKIHTVTQNGVSVKISATKSPYISARGASYVVRVTSDGPWTITIPVNWVSVQIDGQAAGVLTGTGNANVTVTVAPYTNASAFPVARSATINIGGKNHAITQNWKY